MTSILLITPPFTQLNTPYPATAYLMGFLDTKDIPASQMDLGIEVILELFTAARLAEVFEQARPLVQGEVKSSELTSVASDVRQQLSDSATVPLSHLRQPLSDAPPHHLTPNARRIYALRAEYLATIEPVIAFLQGKQPTLAHQIAGENFLPQASRFDQLEELDYAFGSMGHQDKAKHLATLYLEDLSDFIVECVDPDFGFSRYAERIGRSANSFDELYAKLQAPPTFIDRITLEVLERKLEDSLQRAVAQSPIENHQSRIENPEAAVAKSNIANRESRIAYPLVCFSVPFPGNLYSAFRCAQWLKTNYPGITTAMGGGFANTELRSVSDARVFEFFDYITLDDGELPIELLYEHCLKTSNTPAFAPLKRTFHLEDGQVTYNDFSLRKDYRQSAVGTPDYSGLPLDRYISVIEVANPMHSLWSDGRWNKLTMAHGCYWGKCTFCDVSLDYIGNYQPVQATMLVDRMEELIAQTGENGFHFVDEAAPPALMRDLALEIIRRNLRLTWWTNIRFEKSFTPDLCRLLQASGCIAVSGGLEVASDRLLDLIQKGVTVEQVARVTGAFTDAGIMVHSYLMYGYPTQTVQETVDSLEMVRQLFQAGVIQSGFWHQFALTAHSPVGLDPDAYGITPHYQPITFANNDVQFTDSTGIDHDKFSFGLKKSLFNYMHGMCFDFPLQEWFDFRIPKTNISPDYIAGCLEYEDESLSRSTARVVWVGGEPEYHKSADGGLEISLFDRRDTDTILLTETQGTWLLTLLDRTGDRSAKLITLGELRADYEAALAAFEDFWFSEAMDMVRSYGLLVV
ncbi:B12-binding domain-containing radical SAM protein [Neolewinella persica]|uniref:B12-binding domain-containing radical SAM protein n=1 Tax=Neolewinella persica TaxID=70998 RepID=UPI000477AE1F|nr:radical SAM protein [Neolewinella persica]